MKIDGKELQREILFDLAIEIAKLKEKGVRPHIAIVTLGPEASWEIYVRQKTILANYLGIEAEVINLYPQNTEEVLTVIETLNNDPSVHGLIVQRPFPSSIDLDQVIAKIKSDKDIDGFREDSQYEVPAWLAVKHIINYIGQLLNESNLQNFLSNQSILVIGKGGTAGFPTIAGLKKLGFEPKVIDSTTTERSEKLKQADLIISSVGKSNMVTANELKKGVCLIGIGIHRENGKTVGDYDEEEIKDKASYYTPTPGGVGPVNLAYLFKNLVTATKHSIQN